jgi:mono/diheme cytochrome c family protein
MVMSVREVNMKIVLGVVAVIGGLFASLDAYSQMGMMGGPGMMGSSFVRHRFVMHNGVDPRYAALVNPVRATAENLKTGKTLYDRNCVSCHGFAGRGDGPAGRGLNPPPADIASSSKMPVSTDGYLYWTIAEGGTPLGTAMPPFKSVLKEDEIWKIILYLRGL